MKSKEWVLVLFLLSIAFNLPHVGDAALGDGFESVAIARSLAAGQGFANPYHAAATGPTAHAAPLYPALLGIIIFALGQSPTSALAIIVLELLLQAATVALLPWLSKSLFDDRTPGYIGAALMILLRLVAIGPAFETALSALLLIACIGAILHRKTLLAATLLGAVALTSPTVTLAAVPFVFHYSTRRSTVAVLSVAGLLCLPWVIRNRLVLGAWVPVRDSLGLELSLAYDDCAAVKSAQSRCLTETHPNASREAAQAMAALGEVQYNDGRLRRAVSWIARHPQRSFDLTAARIGTFWFPGEALTVAGVTWLAFAGLLLARTSHGFLPFIASLCGYPLAYYAVSAELRRREPVMWMTALLAGCALARLISAYRRQRVSRNR